MASENESRGFYGTAEERAWAKECITTKVELGDIEYVDTTTRAEEIETTETKEEKVKSKKTKKPSVSAEPVEDSTIVLNVPKKTGIKLNQRQIDQYSALVEVHERKVITKKEILQRSKELFGYGTALDWIAAYGKMDGRRGLYCLLKIEQIVNENKK